MSSNAEARIRGFLIMKPKPSRVLVHVDDQEQEVALGRSYAKTAETIAALDFDLIECIDAAGKLLRTLKGDDAKRDPVEVPEVLKSDPLAAAFAMYATQLSRAYEHSTDVAFTKMVEVFDIQAARSEATDRRLERLEAENRKLVQDSIDAELDRAEEVAAEIAKGGGDLGSMLERAFMAGAAQSAPAAATNGSKPNGSKPNGKHINGKAAKAD